MIRIQGVTVVGQIHAEVYPPTDQKHGVAYLYEQLSWDEVQNPIIRESISATLESKGPWKVKAFIFHPEHSRIKVRLHKRQAQ